MSLFAYKNTAAAIAAAAIFETFPEIQLLGGGGDHLGFFYDFDFPHPVHPETLSLIEEKMRQIVRERREIRLLEMVPFTARELLLSQGHETQAEKLTSSRGLVQIVQIGSFHDLSPGPHLKNSHQLAAFKLTSFSPHSHSVRLTGFAYPTKEELQTFLRRFKDYQQRRHEQVGEIQNFWKIETCGENQEIIWLGKGLMFRHQLIQKLLPGVEQICAPAPVDRFALAHSLGKPVAEVGTPACLLPSDAGLYGHPPSVHIFLSDPISLLHSIEKTLNILGLEHKEDLLGRQWPVLATEKVKKGFIVSLSVERIIGFLLETNTLTLERLAIENQ